MERSGNDSFAARRQVSEVTGAGAGLRIGIHDIPNSMASVGNGLGLGACVPAAASEQLDDLLLRQEELRVQRQLDALLRRRSGDAPNVSSFASATLSSAAVPRLSGPYDFGSSTATTHSFGYAAAGRQLALSQTQSSAPSSLLGPHGDPVLIRRSGLFSDAAATADELFSMPPPSNANGSSLSSSRFNHPSDAALGLAGLRTGSSYCSISSSAAALPPARTSYELSAATMQYLAERSAAKAAREMAQAERWARASALANAAASSRAQLSRSVNPAGVGAAAQGASSNFCVLVNRNNFEATTAPAGIVNNTTLDAATASSTTDAIAPTSYVPTIGREKMDIDHTAVATPAAPQIADVPRSQNSSAQDLDEKPSSIMSNLPATLAIPTDAHFLSTTHTILRTSCIELFLSTNHHLTQPGKGARPSRINQVGLRCMHCKDLPRKDQAKQAVCYPSKLENIFESVRNFQRVHIENCKCIPARLKEAYDASLNSGSSTSQKWVKAYYAQAASEIGIKDTTSGGLEFNEDFTFEDHVPPSEELMQIIRASKSHLNAREWEASKATVKKDKFIEMGKFQNVCSENTKLVLQCARNEITPFVLPQDFPTTPDFVWLLFHQLAPCIATPAAFKRRGLTFDQDSHKLPGLCCKHCFKINAPGEDDEAVCKEIKNKQKSGTYYPLNIESLGDSSFSQTLLMHLMTCPNIPSDVQVAFAELKELTREHGVSTKRGAKRKFVEKVWGRMNAYQFKKGQR